MGEEFLGYGRHVHGFVADETDHFGAAVAVVFHDGQRPVQADGVEFTPVVGAVGRHHGDVVAQGGDSSQGIDKGFQAVVKILRPVILGQGVPESSVADIHAGVGSDLGQDMVPREQHTVVQDAQLVGGVSRRVIKGEAVANVAVGDRVGQGELLSQIGVLKESLLELRVFGSRQADETLAPIGFPVTVAHAQKVAVDFVGPQFCSTTGDHVEAIAIVVQVAVGDHHPAHRAKGIADYLQALFQFAQGTVASRVHQGELVALHHVAPGWSQGALPGLGHPYPVDHDAVGKSILDHHAVAGLVSGLDYFRIH